ncbi:hypothetical protein RUM44_001510 [Polyplax serrata]|uniref:Uncharacterized protein n=1 Tax=Polyplax serrata TaxID=468196 RepID=A0ABR1AK79_POLSC
MSQCTTGWFRTCVEVLQGVFARVCERPRRTAELKLVTENYLNVIRVIGRTLKATERYREKEKDDLFGRREIVFSQLCKPMGSHMERAFPNGAGEKFARVVFWEFILEDVEGDKRGWKFCWEKVERESFYRSPGSFGWKTFNLE